ncbi:MAG TPA: NADH-quinone oxidoreductase subunit C [Ktedonobacterales bacterium]
MADQTGAEALNAATNPLAEASVALLTERLGEDALTVSRHRGETTVLLAPSALVEACQALRDAPNLRYDLLEDVTAVDWPEREPRFDLVYQLASTQTGASLRLKTRVGGEDDPEPEAPTVSGVWKTANWFEREVFDLFGVRFTGHPDLRRILMPTDWVGHPLRKDYPLTGFALPDPHWGGQVPFDQPLPEGTGQLTSRTADGSERANLRLRGEDEQPDIGK